MHFLPTTKLNYLRIGMLLAIREYFLDETWLEARSREFKSMTFRQAGYDSEMPVDFIQHCLKYHSFLFPTKLDRPTVVNHIIRRQPPVWISHLNSTECKFIFTLLKTANRLGESLVASWLLTRVNDPAGRLVFYHTRRKKVYVVTGEMLEAEDEEGTGGDSEEEDLDKEVHAARLSMHVTEDIP
jgi:hypothetical protein